MSKKQIIGLTGMTGAGKTTVCSVFTEKGFHVINCDKIARDVTEKGKPCLTELTKAFKEDIIFPDGTLNRKALGAVVFGDSAELLRLNNIIYPFITYDILKEIENSDSEYVLLDAPTLFESGIDFICCKIVSVICSPENSLKRICDRDGIDLTAAKNRLKSQHPCEFYRSKSDICIENNGSLKELCEKAKAAAECLMNMRG